jgi:predicted DNA binding CopG/RHH family protein
LIVVTRMRKIINVRIDEKVWDRFKRKCSKEGIYASEWIRNAIYGYLGISKAGGALDAEA